MDEVTYNTWWALHIRAACGEHLTADEHAIYDAGLRQLHQEEYLTADVTTLQQLRATVAARAMEQGQWQEQRARLDAEIATLEAALSAQARQLLGVQE